MTIEATQNINAVDVAIKSGGIEGLLDLLTSGQISSITDDLQVGQTYEVQEAKYKAINIVSVEKELQRKVTMQKRQNLVDLAIMAYGDVSALVKIAFENDLKIDQTPEVGYNFKFTLADNQMIEFLERKKLVINTGDQHEETNEAEGIGAAIIENTFIVG